MTTRPSTQITAGVLGAAQIILGNEQAMYNDHGVFTLGCVTYIVSDEYGDPHEVRVEFDSDRGDGEYVLVVLHA